LGQRQAPRRMLWCVAAMVAATVLFASSPSGASSPGANGHGNLISSGALRTFSFSVTTGADGTVKGHANVNNRGMGIKAFVDIDCATFLPGGRAILSGTITKSSNPALIVPGRISVFGIEDNGEGANAAVDRITTIPDYAPPKTCTEFTFRGDTLQETAIQGVVVRTLTPILAGNIQVRT
jgi:hypothetical protein